MDELEQYDAPPSRREWVRWITGREPGTYHVTTAVGYVLQDLGNYLLVQTETYQVQVPKSSLDHTYWGNAVPPHLRSTPHG